MTRRPIISAALICLLPLLAAPAAKQEDPQAKLEPADMKKIAEAIGAKAQPLGDKVFALSLPREDLIVRTLDFGEIPVEAGLATTVRLWRCLCGKYYLAGEYVVTEDESNDVLDALRQGNFQIASVAPMLVRDRPRILSIRFQGEGDVDHIAKTLKESQRWVGDNRSKPKPIE
jgi:hypothetical protein